MVAVNERQAGGRERLAGLSGIRCSRCRRAVLHQLDAPEPQRRQVSLHQQGLVRQ